MSEFNKEDAFSASDIRREESPVPEWGWHSGVWCQSWSGTELDAFEAENAAIENVKVRLQNWRARYLVKSLVDKNGNRIFDDTDDAFRLGKKSANVLNRLYEIALRVNGQGEQQQRDTEKNSVAAPSGGSI